MDRYVARMGRVRIHRHTLSERKDRMMPGAGRVWVNIIEMDVRRKSGRCKLN